MSKIEWTEKTLNPTTGCTPVSPGCKNCYAAKMHKRLQGMGQEKYKYDFNVVRTHEKEFDKMWNWKKPRKIFVNSMSDLFHKDIAMDFIFRFFGNMIGANQHIYQILTKRHERLLDFENYTYTKGAIPLKGTQMWSPNIWMGVSVENQKYADIRIPYLIKTSAAIKFLSCEPLLGPLDLSKYLPHLDQIIVGGESGPKSKIRKMELDWARDIRDQCKKYGVAFFFKQTGTLQPCEDKSHDCKGKGCHYLDGQLYQEYPKKVKQTVLEEFF